MAHIPLHHKYRPQIFTDLVGQEAIATTLTNALQLQKIAPAYLFTGPRGTGKTSSARIFAKSLNCMASPVPTAQPCGSCEVCKSIAAGAALDIIEIDAASNTGVDNIREIIERAQYAPVQCRYKVYIIDECHMLTTAAFNSLLKTLEEPPPHVVFVLATTDPQRVLPTIISRCQRFDYRRIPLAAMVGHLTYIAQTEQIDIPLTSITLIAQIAQGGLRDAESLLDQLSLLTGDITPDRVWDLIGSVPEQDLLEILQAIASNDPASLLDRTRSILERGKEPLIIIQNLAGCYRDLLIAKTAPNRPDLVALTSETWAKLGEIAATWQISWILAGQQQLKESEVQIKHTTQPRLWLEITLLGLLAVRTQPAATAPISAPIPTHTPSAPATFSRAIPTVTRQTPPPSAEISPPAPQNTGIDPDIRTIWQQALQQLLPSSKGLFEGYGKLISLTTTHAVVAIKTTTMKSIATSKSHELEQVFSQLLGRSITVKLEVAGKNQPQAAVSPVGSPPPARSPVVKAIEPPPPPSIPPPTEYLSDEEDSANFARTSSTPALESTGSLEPQTAPPELSSNLAELEPPPDFDEPPESFDAERAAQMSQPEPEPAIHIDPELEAATDEIVKIFHGEIIDRHDDLFSEIMGD